MSETVNTKEVWKAIPGYEGRYSISNHGRVFSHLKCRGIRGRILKPCMVSTGYCAADLHINGIRRMTPIHPIVLKCFGRPPIPGEEVNHINGNPSDNRIENLEWVTSSGNKLHAFRVLGKKKGGGPKGMNNWISKLTDEKVREFRSMREHGVSIRQITRISKMDRRSIQMMLRRKSWAHII